MATIILELTTAQTVACRKLSLVAKRNKGLSAEEFAAKLLNSVIASRFEPLHKASEKLESARFDSLIEMGGTPRIIEVISKDKDGNETKESRPETKKEYVSRIMVESADVLESLKKGGDVD